jgi:hypothetical protein
LAACCACQLAVVVRAGPADGINPSRKAEGEAAAVSVQRRRRNGSGSFLVWAITDGVSGCRTGRSGRLQQIENVLGTSV